MEGNGGTHLANVIRPIAVIGLFYRVVHQRFADNVLSLEGSSRMDGRYHRRGEWQAFYTSVALETAWREIEKHVDTRLSRANFSAFEVEVRLNKVADLTDEQTLRVLGVTEDVLIGDDLTICQNIGKRLHDEGFEAILAWSSASRGHKNLVIFLDQIEKESSVTISRVITQGNEEGS